MAALLQTENLIFGNLIHYGNISIPAGKVTFITGESGSGKSTLFKLFNGVVSPSSGAVLYRGQDIKNLDPVLHRQQVLLVSQEPFLFPGSIRDNFNAFHGCRACAAPTDAEIRSYLSLCHMDFPPDSETQTLSGGEKQRLYLAVFLSFLPKVLLLDEPTAALDEATGRAVLGGAVHFCREHGMELLVISHSREMAAAFSENTLALDRKAAS